MLIFVLLASTVSAYSQVTVTEINNRINFGETATFRVAITNQRAESQTYTFFSSAGIQWDVKASGISLTVPANQTKGVDVEVVSVGRVEPGIYIIPLEIKSNTGEVYNKMLEVYIKADTPSEYLPALKTSVDVADKVNPRETQSLKIFIQNQNPASYSNLTLSIKSDLPEFEKEQIIDIKPYETKTVEFTVQPNPHTQPKDYYLFFTLQRGEEIIKTFDRKIEILALTDEFAQTVTETKTFLKTVYTITVTNDGNVRHQQAAKFKMDSLTDLFTSADPNAYVITDETGRYLAWDFELGVNENVTVTLKTNYRIPIIILLILIILAAVYVIYKSPVQITKSASNVVMHEGGVSGLKITLVVKNTGSKPIKDVEVFDTAPSIASVEKDVEVGTLKPAEILRHKKGGLLLKWKISELDGKEERLITYKIKSKLDIVGTILLDRAKVRFKISKGKERVSYSNTYRVGGEAGQKE